MKTQINSAAGMKIKNGKLIYTEILIKATPARIWTILMNFGNYPSWNPFITSISGIPAVGQRLTASLNPPGAKGMTMKPTMVKVEPNREFRWLGSLGLPYIFDGEHSFILHDNVDGTTTLSHFENFRGILIPFFKKMLDVNTIEGFNRMNARLKELAEA